jgi:endonuclease-3
MVKPRSPKGRARETMRRLALAYPDAACALDHRNPYELLAATILSAQTTDVRVNMVTPTLFEKYPTPYELAGAAPGDVEEIVRSTGFYQNKTRSLIGMGTALVERFGGVVPTSMEDLVTLPGVGRKTANVVLGHALGVPGLPVDRHVLRVSNRIGVAKGEDPVVVEQQLTKVLPPEEWTKASDTLILHGRRICKPKPLCDICNVRKDCEYYKKLKSKK